MTDLMCGPGFLPVSTFTLIEPALPGGRTFGKSTAVHPQLGTTDSIFSSDLPTFLTTIERLMDFSIGCLPKSILVAATKIFGAFAGVGVAAGTTVVVAAGGVWTGAATGCCETFCGAD